MLIRYLSQRFKTRWRWVVVAASFTTFVVLFGLLYSYNVLFLAFQKEFESSATLTGWVGSISIGFSLLLAPVVNILIERFGFRSVSLCGVLCASGAVIVTSFLHSLTHMLVTYGLMLGVGASLITVSAISLVILYFPQEGCIRAMAILMAGTSAGMLSFTPLMACLDRQYGWRITLQIIGSLIMVIGFPCVLTFVEPSSLAERQSEEEHSGATKKGRLEKCKRQDNTHPNYPDLNGSRTTQTTSCLLDMQCTLHKSETIFPQKANVEGASPDNHERIYKTLITTNVSIVELIKKTATEMNATENTIPIGKEDQGASLPTQSFVKTPSRDTDNKTNMLRKIVAVSTLPELWMTSVSTVLNGIGDCFYIVNMVSYLVSVGFPEAVGVQAASTIGIANLIGKLLLSLWGDLISFPRIFLIALSNAISICLMVSILFIRTKALILCVAVVVGGVTMSTTNVATCSFPSEFFGPEKAMETSAIIIFSYGLGYTLGSLVGMSIDNTGSYTSAIWAFIGMYVTSGSLMLGASLYQRFCAPERYIMFEQLRMRRQRKKSEQDPKLADGWLITADRTVPETVFVYERVTSV